MDLLDTWGVVNQEVIRNYELASLDDVYVCVCVRAFVLL